MSKIINFEQFARRQKRLQREYQREVQAEARVHRELEWQRKRGLQLTESGRALLTRLNRGEVITDLGQIDQPTRRLLKRWLDKGYVYRGIDYSFPKEKTCWAGAHFWELIEDRESQEWLSEQMVNRKFANL